MKSTMESLLDRTCRSKESIIDNFNREASKSYNTYMKNSDVAFTSNNLERPLSRGTVALSCLKPIFAEDLEVLVTHRGLYIKLTVVSQVLLQTSISCILEDSKGEIVYLSVYNLIPDNLPYCQRYDLAKEKFDLGNKLTIIEPYLGICRDDTLGIRVDSPEDIIFSHDLDPPKTVLEWKNEGKELFIKKKYEESLLCYDRAIDCQLQESNILYLLLLNMAMCDLELGENKECLMYAYIAYILGNIFGDIPFLSEACYHCYSACKALEIQSLVKYFTGRLVKLVTLRDADTCDFEDLMVDFHDDPKVEYITIMELLKVFVPTILVSIQAKPAAVTTEERSKTAMNLNEEGNNLFKDGKYMEAKRIYSNALHIESSSENIALFLRNQSACFLNLNNPQKSALHALSCLCLKPSCDKALYHLSKSLLLLKEVDLSYSLCQVGVDICPNDVTFHQLMKDIEILRNQKLPSSTSTLSSPSEAPGKQYPSERYMMENVYGRPETETTSLEAAKGMSKMMEMMQLYQTMGGGKHNKKGEKGQRAQQMMEYSKLYDAIPVHLEYAKSGLLPTSCNADQCYRKLEEAYEYARGFKVHAMSLIMGTPCDVEYSKKRWGYAYSDASFRLWADSAPLKAVKFANCAMYNLLYLPTILQTFSNGTYQPSDVYMGQVHVSIGFVDLSSLIYNDLILITDSNTNTDASVTSPHRWIGFEMSAYSVAKTLVLIELMHTSTPEVVFQVWYSSVWSAQTKTAFTQTLRNMLTSSKRAYWDMDVIKFLNMWLVEDVSKQRAIDLWTQSYTESMMNILNFSKAIDRHALCTYYFTGQLLEGNYGSTVMFANPTEYGELALNHDFLQTIYYPLLVQERVKTPTKSIIDVGISIVLNRITTWMNHIQSGKVILGVHHTRVALMESESVNLICSYQPTLISWSNVPDYFHPRIFFTLVKTLSNTIQQTISHRMYSMNWSQTTKGACILDFPATDCKTIIDNARKQILDENKILGISKYVFDEIIDNDMNTSGYYLTYQYHMSWIHAFFSTGEMKKIHLEVKIEPYSYFARGQSTIVLSFQCLPSKNK